MSIKKGSNRFSAVTTIVSRGNKRRCGDKNKDGCGAIFPILLSANLLQSVNFLLFGKELVMVVKKVIYLFN